MLSILDHHHHIIITSSSHPENHVTIKSSLNQQLMIQLSPNNHNSMIISFSCIHNFTFCLSWVPLILLSEDIIERPGLQLCDVPQLASLAEILLWVLPWTEDMLCHYYVIAISKHHLTTCKSSKNMPLSTCLNIRHVSCHSNNIVKGPYLTWQCSWGCVQRARWCGRGGPRPCCSPPRCAAQTGNHLGGGNSSEKVDVKILPVASSKAMQAVDQMSAGVP